MKGRCMSTTATSTRPDELSLPKATNASKRSIEAFAEKAAGILGYEVGEEIEPIVKKLGGRLHYQWYSVEETCDVGLRIPESIPKFASDHYSGVLVVKGPNDFDILLSPYTGILRDRFTIAHELGHYFLHSRQGETPLVAARMDSELPEWEANWFAAAFLMPEGKLREFWEKRPHDSYAGASFFQVSQQAYEVRAKSLGLILD